MGFLDRLFGGGDAGRQHTEQHQYPSSQQQRRVTDRRTATQTGAGGRTPDEVALERYRYLLRTAPPERIEQAHAEAFGHLTSDQRRRVFVGLARELPPEERPLSADPDDLARAATRAELRSPGTVEQLLTQSDMDAPQVAAGVDGSSGSALAANGYPGQGPSFGSMFAGSLLGSVAGYVIASTIMSAFLPNEWGDPADASSGDEPGEGDSGADAGTDAGYDAGGWGGDFGGGDFGGGDFGGGFDI